MSSIEVALVLLILWVVFCIQKQVKDTVVVSCIQKQIKDRHSWVFCSQKQVKDRHSWVFCSQKQVKDRHSWGCFVVRNK